MVAKLVGLISAKSWLSAVRLLIVVDDIGARGTMWLLLVLGASTIQSADVSTAWDWLGDKVTV